MSALVLYGPQHTGKSLLTELLELVVGLSNCQTISNHELSSTFTEWAESKLLIIAEEVSGLDPRHDSNRIKGFITLPRLIINSKFIRLYTLPNLARFIFLSNMVVPLFLDKDDRRYAVCKTRNVIPSQRGVELKRWAVKEGGAAIIRDYLEHVDLNAFDPTHNPPWTDDKTRLVNDSRSSLVTFAHDLMADEERPGIAFLIELMHAAKNELETTPTLKALSNALDDAGAITLPRVRIRQGASKYSVYSLREPLADVREKTLRAMLNKEAPRREKFFNLIMPTVDKESKFTRPPSTDHFAEDHEDSSSESFEGSPNAA